jgi:hypothetical protein
MKKWLALLCTVTFFLLSITSAESISHSEYTFYNNGEHIFVGDSKNAYYVSYSGSSAVVNLIGKSNRSLELDSEILSCHYVKGNFYFMLKTVDKNTTIVKFNYSQGRYTEFTFGDFKNNNKFYFVPDSNGNYYVVNQKDKFTLIKYSSSGEIVKKWQLPDAIKEVETFDGSEVYVITGSVSYKIKSNILSLLSENYMGFPINMMTQRYFSVDGYVRDGNNGGNIVASCNGELTAICSTGVFNVSGNTIVYTPFNGGEEKKCTVSGDISNIYSLNNKIYAVTDGGIYTLSLSDLKTTKSNDSDTQTLENISSSGSISSSVYEFKGKYIKNINPKTSITSFKENISYDGFNVEFTSNGVTKTSGYVKTGMVITFSKGNVAESYIAVVMGDVTCDGKVNTKDTDMLIEYLFGKIDFSEECFLSADLMENNKLSNADLVKVARLRE